MLLGWLSISLRCVASSDEVTGELGLSVSQCVLSVDYRFVHRVLITLLNLTHSLLSFEHHMELGVFSNCLSLSLSHT
jgi:hypothetical protein